VPAPMGGAAPRKRPRYANASGRWSDNGRARSARRASATGRRPCRSSERWCCSCSPASPTHALKTRRPYWWIFVIMAAPVMGCVIYYFVEVFPGTRGRRGRRMGQGRGRHRAIEAARARDPAARCAPARGALSLREYLADL